MAVAGSAASALTWLTVFIPYFLGRPTARALVCPAYVRIQTAMPRRLSIIALFAAWLCASGAMLDVVQVFAWAKMFTRYTQAMPVGEAAAETFDPSKPCRICLAVRRARDESKSEQPARIATDVHKVVLVFHEVEAVVFAHNLEGWPETQIAELNTWRAPVPVPPPRRIATGWTA